MADPRVQQAAMTTDPLIGRSDLTEHEARQKLAGWHFAKESLTRGERDILYVAEAVLCHADALARRLEAAEETLRQVIDYVPEGFVSPMDDEDSMNYRAIACAYFDVHPASEPTLGTAPGQLPGPGVVGVEPPAEGGDRRA